MTKTHHIRLTDQLDDMVTEMQDKTGETKVHIIRKCIEQTYDKFITKKYGYQSGSATGKLRVDRAGSQAEQSEFVKSLRQLFDKADYVKAGEMLYEIEYCKRPVVCKEENLQGWVAYETFNVFPGFGAPGFYHFRYSSDTDSYRDRAFIFTIDELVADLIKQKYV